MWLAVDVSYDEGRDRAQVAGVFFDRFDAAHSAAEYVVSHRGLAPYQPGAFYLRELPCLMTLLGRVGHPVTGIVVDGYVDLGPDKPGLGRILYGVVEPRVPVIGVAKTAYADAVSEAVVRGESLRPLYVTAVGLTPAAAAASVQAMHGAFRIPTLLKRVDRLSREVPH